jgi:hypothetical protein
MNRPVREHLNNLPEPYRSKALENFDAPDNNWKNEEDECRTPSDAIHIAFDWASSKEGWAYWNRAISVV